MNKQNTVLALVAEHLRSVWEGVKTQDDCVRLTDEFSFPVELHDAVRELMLAAAQADSDSGIVLPEDPAAPWGKWHRAANIASGWVETFARESEFRVVTGDWSWYAFLEVVGVFRRRVSAGGGDEDV